MVAELSPERWRRDLDRVRDGAEIDLLVVGGGVVGAGIALDAATRGLRVVLVEARDFAAGTSSGSSKLIHGGLRYLKTADFKLVWEALRERGILLELAPHLVHPLPFLYLLRRRVLERIYVALGIGVYDLMSRIGGTKHQLPRLRNLSRRGTRRLVPGLAANSFIGAVEYHDAQVDDSRFVVDLVRTAVSSGAIALNNVMLTHIERESSRVASAQLECTESGERFAVRPRAIVLATGVWSERTMALFASDEEVMIQPSKGVHLVFDRDRIDSQRALILPTSKSVLFVLPWDGHWIVGTTDTKWEFGIDEVTAGAEDVSYLLACANSILASPLTVDDVKGVFVGLRPLIAAGVNDTTKLSREHAIARLAANAVAVSGGKFTTYRVMAREAVDAVLDSFDRDPGASRTDKIALLGARGYQQLWDGRAQLAADTGLSPEKIEQMLGRYGVAIIEVLDLLEADPRLALPLNSDPEYLRAEIAHSVTHEGARHVDDVLSRRFHMAIEEQDRGVASAIEIAPLIAPLLHWTDEQLREETERYLHLVDRALSAERR